MLFLLGISSSAAAAAFLTWPNNVSYCKVHAYRPINY